MTRRALAARIAKLSGVTVHQAAQVLEVLPAVVAAELTASGQLHWRGMGSFAVRAYPARKIHNPATGKTIELPARNSVTFKPSTRIRSRLKPPRTRRPARA